MSSSTVQHCINLCSPTVQVQTVSLLQRKVGAAFHRQGYKVEFEKPILGGFKPIDLVITSKAGVCMGVEVDGPFHYLGTVAGVTERKLSAATRLRNYIVKRALMRLAPHSELPPLPFSHYFTVSYHDWNGCDGDHQRESQLLDTLLSTLGQDEVKVDADETAKETLTSKCIIYCIPFPFPSFPSPFLLYYISFFFFFFSS